MQAASFESVSVSEFMVLKIASCIRPRANPSENVGKYLHVQLMIRGSLDEFDWTGMPCI